jgi:hypothetical protein
MRRDVATELKELRLLGMVGAWTDLLAQGESQIAASKWLIEHLLQAEHTDRAMRSISHQMKVAMGAMVQLVFVNVCLLRSQKHRRQKDA